MSPAVTTEIAKGFSLHGEGRDERPRRRVDRSRPNGPMALGVRGSDRYHGTYPVATSIWGEGLFVFPLMLSTLRSTAASIEVGSDRPSAGGPTASHHQSEDPASPSIARCRLHLPDLVSLPDHVGPVNPAPILRHCTGHRLDPAGMVVGSVATGGEVLAGARLVALPMACCFCSAVRSRSSVAYQRYRLLAWDADYGFDIRMPIAPATPCSPQLSC